MPIEIRPPKIVSFKSCNRQVADFDTITLSWATENAKYVTLNGLHVTTNGSKVLPAQEEYILRAKNEVDTVEKKFKVTITYPLSISRCEVRNHKVNAEDSCFVDWEGRNISSILLDGKRISVVSPITFVPDGSGEHSVIFEGKDGTLIKKDFAIEMVYPKPTINIFAPEFAQRGETTKILWMTKYASSVMIDDKVVANTGSLQWEFSKESMNKELVIQGLDGKTYKKKTKIRMALPAVIDECTLSAKELTIGQLCTLSWNGKNVIRWYMDESQPHEASETELKFQPQNSRFTVYFVGEDGSVVEKRLSLKLYYKPEIDFCVVTEQPRQDVPCTLEWSSKYVEKVLINGKEYAAKDKLTYQPEKNEIVEVCFVGENGERYMRSLEVKYPSCIIDYCDIASQKTSVIKGETITLSWKSINVNSVTISGDNDVYMADLPACGSQKFVINKDQQFTITFLGQDGKSTKKTIKVAIIPPVNIRTCSANYPQIKYGESCTINWSADNVTDVYIVGHNSRFSGCDSYTFSPKSSKELKVEFYGLDGSVHYRTIKVEVEKTHAFLKLLLDILLVITITFIGFTICSQIALYNARTSFDKNIRQADISHIESLETAYQNYKIIQRYSKDSQRYKILKNKTNSIYDDAVYRYNTAPQNRKSTQKNKLDRVNRIRHNL